MQIAFLPYHDVTTTWINRIALTVDIAHAAADRRVPDARRDLVLPGVLALDRDASRYGLRRPPRCWSLVVYLSFFAATVPGEPLDRVSRDCTPGRRDGESGRVQQSGFVLPFLSPRADGTLFGVFHRNLVVTDSDLTDRPAATAATRRLNLRGRDLRYAKLDRTDLSRRRPHRRRASMAQASSAPTCRRPGSTAPSSTCSCCATTARARKCSSARGADFSRADLERRAHGGRRSARCQARGSAPRWRRSCQRHLCRRQLFERAPGEGRPDGRRAGAGHELPQRLACRAPT